MMEADERELLVRSLDHAVAGAADGPALDTALAGMGWADALAVAPREAITGVASALGQHAATASALHRVVALGLTGSTDAPGALLPLPGVTDPPGRLGDGHIEVRGLANAALLAGGSVTVAVRLDGERVGHVVLAVDDLDVQPVRGLDPDAGLAVVTGHGPTPDPAVTGDWDEALRLGRLSLAHELQGASAAVLAQAREHALDRIQFGQPIAAFQAVRHKLAEILIATETADALLDAAWTDGTPLTASMAKAAAGRAGRVTIRHGQQVLAGIGFTTEHGLHRWVRRVLLLDELLGSSRHLTEDLGSTLLAERTLPPLLPL